MISNVISYIMIACCVWTCIYSKAITNQARCSEPSVADLQKRFAKLNNGLDIRALLIPYVWTNLEIEYEHLFTLTNTHEISKQCPSTYVKGTYPVMIRSSCPWYFASDLDNLRYPKLIDYAKTNCYSCVGSNGQQGCEAIHQKIKILKRKDCENNVYQYVEEDFALPVAYTCAQAKEFGNSNKAQPPKEDLPVPI